MIHFTSDKNIMGAFVNRLWIKILAWIVTVLIVALNIKLVTEQIVTWANAASDPILVYLLMVPVVIIIVALFLYIAVKPFVRHAFGQIVPRWRKLGHFILAGEDGLNLDVPEYRRVGVAIGATEEDRKTLSHALYFARKYDAILCLFHVVEGAGGQVYGQDALDAEAREDQEYLTQLAKTLVNRGVDIETFLGFGNVVKGVIGFVEEQKIDVLFMGSHGHRGVSQMIFGSTIAPVKKAIGVPVVVVK